MMKKNIFTVILCMGVGISAVTMTGCGKNLTQIAQQQEDDCVVVKLPEGYGARDLFDIVSSTETFITYASEGFGSGKSIYTGVIIPGLFEPPVRTLRATIPENESHIFR